MRSKLPSAEKFEEWVVGTVLPAIRKTGGYIQGEENVETEEN
jgi:prophage antirepressor-like protein